MVVSSDRILIIGCGCFGASTAYHLLKRGFTDVAILDRSPTLPALDAASNDLNRIVRTSYADKFYSDLAREAISLWKQPEWGDAYHESGVIVLGFSGAEARGLGTVAEGANSEKAGSYADESYLNDISLGADVRLLGTSDDIRSIFPLNVRTASFSQQSGYLNRDGGWANAGKGLALLIEKVVELGGKVFPGKDVKQTVRRDGKTIGVLCSDGVVYDAQLVVVATGSWTPSAFPEIDLKGVCLATGQCIAMVQLSQQEADEYRQCPVVLDFSSGFYIFPPNEANIVKMAIHSVGYIHTQDNVSTPRTICSDPTTGSFIPKSAVQELRTRLRNVYPDLAQKPFCGTRLCWYNDSPDGDWVISRYPGDEYLILATAGSGHAYKFLPVIGRTVADLIEDKLHPSVVSKFSISRARVSLDSSRSGEVQELDLSQLCTKSDLLFGEYNRS